MKKLFLPLSVCAMFAALFYPVTARAQASTFDADKVVFCSDGEFDWVSGQSLYDFVLLLRDDGKFLISYLGIPHPSFEKRDFDNAWLKVKGSFSAKRLDAGRDASRYQLTLALADGPTHIGTLAIDDKGKYRYNVSPALPLEYVTSEGLCWDSLSREPNAIRNKRRR